MGGSINFTPGEVATYYGVRLPRIRQRGRDWRCPCPLHRGKGLNFSISAETGRWHCFSKCGRGGSMIDFEAEITGANFKAALTEVFAVIGRRMPERPPISARRVARHAALRRRRGKFRGCRTVNGGECPRNDVAGRPGARNPDCIVGCSE